MKKDSKNAYIKQEIKEQLGKTYVKSDGPLINLIVKYLDLIDEALEDIEVRGLFLNVTVDPNRPAFINPNPAHNVLDTKVQRLMVLYDKLGLTKSSKKVVLESTGTTKEEKPWLEKLREE